MGPDSMKILIVSSSSVKYSHGSGEEELLQLQIGFKLLGYQCDVAGPESEDFDEYDLYLYFSIRDDVLETIDQMNPLKSAVLFPQVEGMESKELAELSKLSVKLPALRFQARTDKEVKSYSSLVGSDKVAHIPGWFIKPFIHSTELDDIFDNISSKKDYVLAFMGYGRDEGVELVSRASNENSFDFIVTSDRVGDFEKKIIAEDNVNILKKEKYGSARWYELLSNCNVFFESNDRLTCSLLEALWLRKTVVSPHYRSLNKLLGKELVFESNSNLVEVKQVEKFSRSFLMKFHVDEVCKSILTGF
jgi:hypothetical protein